MNGLWKWENNISLAINNDAQSDLNRTADAKYVDNILDPLKMMVWWCVQLKSYSVN